MPLAAAREVAGELRDLLAPACRRIEIAGSIRRERPMVSDIELVAIPRFEEADGGDLWGTRTDVDALDRRLGELRDDGVLAYRAVEVHRADGRVEHQTRIGRSYQALVYREMPVDLFIVHPPAEWGVIFAIRTGPGDWNQRIVTDCQRYLRRVENGQVWRSGQRIPCPEEADFFAAVGQPWVEPRERSVERVRIQARVA
jgi:DNA polymerase/3'-5' exonuclease PolX